MVGKRNLCIPGGLVIGPQRAGTTWLHQYFLARGDVCLPKNVKETFFFDRNYDRGVTWYARHYHPRSCTRMIMEVGPTYFHHPDAPIRVRELLGCVPVVATLRDPTARIYSLYIHMLRYGMTSLAFRDAVETCSTLLASSRYATNLRRWLSVLTEDAVLVVFHEDLANQTQSYVRQICSHFGLEFRGLSRHLSKPVNPAAMPANSRLAALGQTTADKLRSMGLYGAVNIAKNLGLKALFFGSPGARQVPSLSPRDEQWIRGRLDREVCDLERLLNVDLSHWRT